ncbi:pentatricopeptide repeat-containing protein At4g02750-like [Pyrus communis]|uniref:pentatricopeptide repeat-containing protein At4g02750-like n=1 Tax=Pyrus communis TaxID=23211 RepID=UPI0035BF6829
MRFVRLPVRVRAHVNFIADTCCILHCLISLRLKLFSTYDVYTCNVKIGVLSRAGKIEAARQLFDEMPTKDVVTWNAIITGYWKNGYFGESKRLFRLMPVRNVVSWNSMLAGSVENEMVDEAFMYFREMPERNIASWNAMISGFVKCDRLEEASRIFQDMPKRNVISYTAMIDGYAMKGEIERARALFDCMPRKNAVSWTVLISGYVENGKFDEARELYEQMPEKNAVSMTAMLTGYSKEGKMEDARALFDQIQRKDHVSWNAMITGYAQNGGGEEALKLHSQKLKIGLHPDKWTLVSVLTACSSLTSLKDGKQAHLLIIKHGFESNLSLYNALITMYNKCGAILDAELVFKQIECPDLVSWNTIIAAFAQHGLYEKALDFFNQTVVHGFKPDGITFLSLLSACAHAGKVNESLKLFDLMVSSYNIAPRSEHYACLVDILCRAGQLEKACKMIQEMPFQADSGIWGSLLAACSIYLNVEIGELAAKNILHLNPRSSGPYVALSNIYAAAGKWRDVARMRSLMKEHGVKKQQAQSWTEIANKVHIFLGGDVSHPDIDKIHLMLKTISLHIPADDFVDITFHGATR